MRRLFTVHPSCDFSIFYLNFSLKSNTLALSGTVSLLAGLAATLLVFSMLCETSLQREDFILEEGLDSGCVLSAKVCHK